MSLLLDTSVLLSLFVEDIHTQQAENIFRSVLAGDEQGYFTTLILVEVCGAVRRRAGKESAERALAKLQEWSHQGILELLDHNTEIIQKACSSAIGYSIKGADALIAATTDYHQLQQATFDEEVKERLKSRIEFYSAG